MSFGSMTNYLNSDYVQPDICKPAFAMNGYNVIPPQNQAPFANFGNMVPLYYKYQKFGPGIELFNAFEREYKRENYLETVRKNLLNGRYYPMELLGRGTFGKVYKCHDFKRNKTVAVKVINLQGKTSLEQTLMEVRALKDLNKFDIGNKHFVEMLDYFTLQNEQCIVFEMLPCSLFDELLATKGTGFNVAQLRSMAFQLIIALAILAECNIVHCDLKPENVMLDSSTVSGIKVADLGSCCYEGHQVYSYIQSRFYRAPEVILELPYGSAIDVWSTGCLLAELSTGSPLFSGRNYHDQLARIMEYMGPLPNFMILRSQISAKFFAYSPINKRIEFIVGKNVKFNGYYTKNLRNFLLSNKYGELFEEKLLYNGFSGIDDSFENLVYSMLNLNPQARATPYDLILHPFLYNIIANTVSFSENEQLQIKSETSRKRTFKVVREFNSVEKQIVNNSIDYVTTYVQKMKRLAQYHCEMLGALPLATCQNENCELCMQPY